MTQREYKEQLNQQLYSSDTQRWACKSFWGLMGLFRRTLSSTATKMLDPWCAHQEYSMCDKAGGKRRARVQLKDKMMRSAGWEQGREDACKERPILGDKSLADQTKNRNTDREKGRTKSRALRVTGKKEIDILTNLSATAFLRHQSQWSKEVYFGVLAVNGGKRAYCPFKRFCFTLGHVHFMQCFNAGNKAREEP